MLRILMQFDQFQRNVRHFTTLRDAILTPKVPLESISSSSTFDMLNSSFKSTLKQNEYPTTPPLNVPAHISRPSYAMRAGGSPDSLPHKLFGEVKSIEAITKMKRAGSIASAALQLALDSTEPGVTGLDIERIVHDYIISQGAYPSPLNFHGYPKSLVVSVNEGCCHGIPNSRPFQNGDIIKYDCIVFFDGYHGDCAASIGVGELSTKRQQLIDTCRLARDEAIRLCKPGFNLKKIGDCISDIARDAGFGVVNVLSGHFIGCEMHMLPLVNHTRNSYDFMLHPGHTFTIEPILTEGSIELLGWEDGWTIVTKDSGFSAQFEHTILITDTGHEILTPLREKSTREMMQLSQEKSTDDQQKEARP